MIAEGLGPITDWAPVLVLVGAMIVIMILAEVYIYLMRD